MRVSKVVVTPHRCAIALLRLIKSAYSYSSIKLATAILEIYQV